MDSLCKVGYDCMESRVSKILLVSVEMQNMKQNVCKVGYDSMEIRVSKILLVSVENAKYEAKRM